MIINSLKSNLYSQPLRKVENKNKFITLTKTDAVSFNGLRDESTPCLFVFDLDGTFANGNDKDLKEVLKLEKGRNATLIYATGRTYEEVLELQDRLEAKGVSLPTPDYLVANNGQFVYTNINGILVEDMDYRAKIKETTNFDKDIVFQTIKELARRPEYLLNSEKLNQLKSMNNFKKRKKIDGKFWNSKITYYEWNPSSNMLEFLISSDINLEKLQKDIVNSLEEKGIKNKFILNKYPKEDMDTCPENIILQSRPFREGKDGSMYALFICASDKAGGTEYLKEKLDIPYSEIVMAGNEDNDKSLVDLTLKGAFFISVGNAVQSLKKYIAKIKEKPDNNFSNNIIAAKNNGASGIAEGIKKIISQLTEVVYS